jgi:hypothetical protein
MSTSWRMPEQTAQCQAVDSSGHRCALPAGHTEPHSAGPTWTVPASPPPVPGWRPAQQTPKARSSRGTWILAGIVVVVILLLAGSFAGRRTGGDTETPPPSTAAEASALGAAGTSSEPSSESEEPSTGADTEPLPTLAPAFKTVTLSGKGNKVARFNIPEDAAAIATISYTGGANFVVWSIDSGGSENDLLVNTIGKYHGTVLFDETQGTHSVAFKLEASGPWIVKIKPVTAARPWDGISKVSGEGDDVLLIPTGISGLSTAVIKHGGKENFVVYAYTPDGTELLVNEIGKFSGEELIPDGTLLIAVQADGAWSINPS